MSEEDIVFYVLHNFMNYLHLVIMFKSQAEDESEIEFEHRCK